MEQKQAYLSLLALGLGVGLGLGLASARSIEDSRKFNSLSVVSPTSQLLELELMAQVVDGRDSSVTFDKFPYYLNEQTRIVLTNAAFVHLKQLQYSKFTRNLSPASRTILLSGPAGTETYHQMLAKALAHFVEAKLLILDVIDFSLKLQSKVGNVHPTTGVARRFFGLLSSKSLSSDTNAFSARSSSLNGRRNANSSERRHQQLLSNEEGSHDAVPKTDRNFGKGSSLKRTHSWAFEDKLLVVALYKVLSNLSEAGPTVLYLRDVEKLVFKEPKTFSLFQKMIKKLSGPVLILGSRILESTSEQVGDYINEKLATLFPYNIEIKPPEDNAKLISWRSQLEEDMKAIESQDNRNHISEVLAANDVECDDLGSICFNDTLLLGKFIEEIVVSAISHHVMNTEEPQHHSGRLVISAKSLAHGLSLFQAGQLGGKDAKLPMENNAESPKETQETSAKAEGKSEASTETKTEGEKSDAVKSDASKKGGDVDGSKTSPAPSSTKVLFLPFRTP